MPTSQDFPTVNGDECSWADITLKANVPGGAQQRIAECEGIKWSGKVEVGESSGTSGGRVMKTTAGSEKSEASATFTFAGLKQLREMLEVAAVAMGAVRGNDVILSAVRFDILIQYSPLGVDDIYETKLTSCRYLGDSDDAKQGSEASMVEVTLNPIRITRKSSTGRDLVLR